MLASSFSGFDPIETWGLTSFRGRLSAVFYSPPVGRGNRILSGGPLHSVMNSRSPERVLLGRALPADELDLVHWASPRTEKNDDPQTVCHVGVVAQVCTRIGRA
jgi:hypothetical protein